MILKDIRGISSIVSRYNGYEKALKEAGILIDKDLICDVSKVDHEHAKNGILEKINSNIKFDGIFATNDWMALGAIGALSERNIKVPEDVKVVGFDDMSISAMTVPSITTINQDTEKMGEHAIEILMDIITNKDNSVRNISIPVKLIKRRSTE